MDPVHLHDCYWFPANGDDGKLDGPFSPPVWDDEQKRFRMGFIRVITSTEPKTAQFQCTKTKKVSKVPLEFMERVAGWNPPPEEPRLGGRIVRGA